jgi:beta-lactamase class A
MTPSIARRTVLAGSLLALPVFANDVVKSLGDLEARNGGRLGVAALATANGRRIGYRADELFPMCSTFKFLLAAEVLALVDAGKERLDRRLVFSQKDVSSYAPVTKHRVGGRGMSLAELCDAIVTLSDNTAANVLLANLGGPSALTAFVRGLGDDRTRLDRIEPALNQAAPGDPRDTTTPAAMLGDMQRLLVGDALQPASRERLIGWLVGCKTGDHRLRAGFPADWRAGDKTGTGENGTANDIAIAWPRGGSPILVTAYYTGSTMADAARDKVIAECGRLAVAALG